MSLFFRTITHLLPDAAAWRVTTQKTLRRFLEGLAGAPADAQAFVDSVYEDAFPATTRALSAWEEQFGLTPNPDEATRRLNLAAEWASTGGQSPGYIQGVLHTAGFIVYVHEWWSSGPPYVARDPRVYTSAPLIGETQCGEALALCGEPLAECSDLLANEPGYLVNKDLTLHAPPQVTDDPTKWPYFLYIADEIFPNPAVVPVSRRAELERLLLKLCPAQQWIVTRIHYIDEDEVIATHTSSGSGYETVAALTYTVPDGWTVEVMFRAVGRQGSEYAKYVFSASYTRLPGGAAQLDWNLPAGSPKEIDAAWDARINLNGNNLEFQVKQNAESPGVKWDLQLVISEQALPS
jgi:hypothetical protein